MIEDNNILIFGGTGSVGQYLVKRLIDGVYGNPKKITIFSRDEAKQYDMKNKFNSEKLKFVIGDIRNYTDVSCVLTGSDIIINAAAMKQIPSCEQFPDQAVLTNVIGFSNILKCVKNFKIPVKTILNISTDKACLPTSVMGMTKSIQESMLLNSADDISSIKFIGVRYGNVVRSRGSVIPLFEDQLKRGINLTVTSKKMTRFLITLNSAVDCIFYSIFNGRSGEIFIPILKSVKIYDIAVLMAKDKNIDIIGNRSGEKIHEILFNKDESSRIIIKDNYFVIGRSKISNNYYEYSSENNLMSDEDFRNFADINCIGK